MENIIISSLDFEETKKNILEQGVEKFHVLADFDRTLTRAFCGENKLRSMISYLRQGNYISEDYVIKSNALFDEYHPMEIDMNTPLEEKKVKMQEWWKKHFDLFIEYKLNKSLIEQVIKDMINENHLVFREGVEEFLSFLKENNIPLVIISASVGDMIIEFFKQKGVYYENIHIISNNLDWDENGNALGVKQIIHVFNKAETEVNVPGLAERKNVFLIGDMSGDLGMIEGFDYDNLITIGFLNENIEENLDSYKEIFDVVIVGDGDFSFINDFLNGLKIKP